MGSSLISPPTSVIPLNLFSSLHYDSVVRRGGFAPCFAFAYPQKFGGCEEVCRAKTAGKGTLPRIRGTSVGFGLHATNAGGGWPAGVGAGKGDPLPWVKTAREKAHSTAAAVWEVEAEEVNIAAPNLWCWFILLVLKQAQSKESEEKRREPAAHREEPPLSCTRGCI
jgi:hypothetical protein